MAARSSEKQPTSRSADAEEGETIEVDVEEPTQIRLEKILLMSALSVRKRSFNASPHKIEAGKCEIVNLRNTQLANLLVALDTTITTTALPAITTQLHSAAGYAWIGSAYVLATAVTAPVWAKLSDIWGRKPLLLLAISVFFIGSLLCGLATSMLWLILSRALQGVGGSGISI